MDGSPFGKQPLRGLSGSSPFSTQDPQTGEQLPGGTIEVPAPGRASDIDAKWWQQAAGQIIEKMPSGRRSGSGASTQQVDNLAGGLRAIIGTIAPDEGALRQIFGTSSGSSEDRRGAMVDKLVSIAGPAVSA